MFSQKSLLLSAVAGSVLLLAGTAQAQSAGGADAPYYLADGSRTADYQAALASWRADPQFAVDYSKAYLGLEHAYARGLTGKGVTVGINDSGVYWDHPLFAGRNINGLDTGANDDLGNNGSISASEPWHAHGTHVAGTAVGSRTPGGLMFGNAYGADIYSATVHFVSNNFAFGPAYFSGEPMGDAMANLLAIADGNHARIINNSWGVTQSSLRYDATQAQIDAYFNARSAAITALDWSGVLQNDTLIVMSAGNVGQAHTSLWNMAPKYVEGLRDNYLTVTNYRANDTQNSSNLCGAAATWCMTGPGTNIVSSVPDFDFNEAGWSETYDYMELVNDQLFVLYLQYLGVDAAISYKMDSLVSGYIDRRDTAEANGQAFDVEAERQALALEISDFSKHLLSLFTQPKYAIGIDVGTLTITLESAIGRGLSAADAAAISRAYNEDFLGTLKTFMGDTFAAYAVYNGTSMAAPNISGFAALVIEQFPEYDTGLITDIILSSGRDIEAAGVDIRAGWGVPQMGDALQGPSALRAVREVRVNGGTRDIWTHDIADAIDRYSPLVLERNPNDIGGLTKIGGGELILTGRSTYSGETRVREGLLTLNGALTRSALTVENVGIIGGTGTLASLTAAQGGVVAPGNVSDPFGTLTVSGNATFLPGSFLWVRANQNASLYSRLNVGGTTTLQGGNVIVKADTGTWNLRRRGLDILTSAGGVTGTFDGVTSDLGFLTPTLTYLPTGVQLQLVRNDVTIASAGTTQNERNAGAALDAMTAGNTGGNLELEDAILDGSFAAVQTALRALTGEVHASLGGLTAANANSVREAMLDRGRTMPAGASAEQAINTRGVTAWASGLWGNGEFDGDDDYRAYRNDTNGYAVGIDKVFEGGGILGIALGQTRSELKINELASSGKSTTTQVGLYGGGTVRGFGLRVGGTYIDSDFDTTRSVSLNRFSNRLTGEYGGDGWQAWAEASFALQAGHMALEPYLNYTHYDFQADVAETGGDAALQGALDHKADLLTAGLRTNTLLAGDAGRPQVRLVGHLAYTENLDDDGLVFRARFADGPGFDISGPQPLDGGMTTGLGVNIKATETLSFDVGYSGLHQSDFSDNRVQGRIALRF